MNMQYQKELGREQNTYFCDTGGQLIVLGWVAGLYWVGAYYTSHQLAVYGRDTSIHGHRDYFIHSQPHIDSASSTMVSNHLE